MQCTPPILPCYPSLTFPYILWNQELEIFKNVATELFFLFNIQVAQNSSYIRVFLREAVVLQNSKEMCWVASDEITHHMIGSRVPSGNFPWNFLSDVVELLCVKKGMQHPPLKDSVSFNNSSRCGAFRAVHDCHAHETQDFCYRKDSFKNSNHLFLNIIVASETAHFIYVEQKVSISSRWWCYIDLWWYIYISHWEYIYLGSLNPTKKQADSKSPANDRAYQ